MFSSRRKLIKFIKILLFTVICSFFLSLLIALIHTILIVNINAAIFGLTLLISSIIAYFYNEKLKRDKYKIEPIKHIELIESHRTSVQGDNNRAVQGDNNQAVQGDGNQIVTTTIGRDHNENKNTKNITVGNRKLEINPNDIIKTFDELRDILAQSIAQSSNALEAISEFINELTEEFRNRPEVKVCFSVDGNINEEELVKKIFKYLLNQGYDQISKINQSNLIVRPELQKKNISNSSEFIEHFEYCGNDEYDVVYKKYTIHLFQEQSKGWLYKIRRSNSPILERGKITHSCNIYFAIGRAVKQIDKELKNNWFNNPE